jgi:hypothetical protein
MAERPRVPIVALAVCWALTALAFIVRALLTADTTPLILDTDDAMRLTQVHDFLNGQGWFDLVQHRLNTPWGGEIHWSRLVDVPEAALLAGLRPLFGASADVALAYAWPLLLLALLLWLTARLATRLGGPPALLPALLLPAFSLIAMAEFAPGRLDHHSLQILLALAMLDCAMAALVRPRFALGAGVAAAVALAIGIEGVPMVAAAVLVFGLMWVGDRRHGVALRDFGLSLALGTVLALAQGVPPARWFSPMVDAISIVYAGAAVFCGLAFLALSLLPLRTWRARLAAGVVAGGLVVALVLGLWPGLLKGPYGALDPWLLANWIDRISEAEPWLISLSGEPVYPLAVAVPAFAALAAFLWNLVRRPADREAWLVYGVFLIVAIAVMVLQIRGARIAVPLAVPGGAVLIGAAWSRLGRGIGALLALGAAWIASAGIAVALLATLVVLAFPDYADATTDKFRAARQACLMPGAFADLAGLPPERIMAPIDLGSHLLLYTPHSVVAAPYHRNAEAVLDAFRFFNGPLEAGRAILAARGIGLVVVCPAMKEIRGLVAHTPDSFVTLYAAGRLPAWLVDESVPGSPLKLYAVTNR